jgi:hypothetical protein
MGKNEIFTSPLGLGLGIGLGSAVGALTIGLISFVTYKYMDDNTDDKSRYSSSSMFSLPESERTSSFTEEPQYEPKRYPLPNSEPTGQHTKIRGGKRSKKRKRKNKVKKHNTFKK